ncbi:shieldin complex subunit 3 isoform X2 [Pimephales promelas]|uniref:shieldin complex subunit 3 isoform X2 n=1 Tax=Pimephales promelas TaxID=90988 RepID=UPI001955C02C|nr:shieldin complex subunit 3 isoform X2 [Pimephales promelas]KAG1930263.1 shieldin complex subunit [Pimephales promelas]
MSQEMKEDVSVYFRPLLELRDVVLLTQRVLQDFPNTILPEFKPWFPSASDSRKPIRPRKPPPLISSSEIITHQIPNEIPHQIPNQITHQIPNQIPHQIPNEIPHQIPNEITHQIPNEIPHQIPNEITHQILNEITHQIPHQIPNKIPHQIPNEIPHQIPNEITHQILNEIPHQIPNEIPHEIPHQIPNEIPHQIPNEITHQIPREASDSRSQSKPVPDPQRFERSWCVISHRSAPLRIPRSFSRPFRRIIEDHGLDLRQRVKWVVCERNCGSRDMEDLWRDLIRAVRRSRMPSCNANFQRALAQIWLYCDVRYCEDIGDFLKQEFQLCGKITLTVHKLGELIKL